MKVHPEGSAGDPATTTKVSPDALEIHKLAFEQGLKSLSDQEGDLSALRQRSTAIVSISGLAATLLGREALSAPSGDQLWLDLGSLEWLALISLCISLVCTAQILRPRDGWVFHNSPTSIIEQFAQGEHATSLCTTYLVLAGFCEDNYASNKKMLNPLYLWLEVALFAVGFQIVFWTLAIN